MNIKPKLILLLAIACCTSFIKSVASPDTVLLKKLINTPVAADGLSFAAVGNGAFIQYRNTDSVYRVLVDENGVAQMQSNVGLPASKGGNISQVQKQMDKEALLQNPVFNELGSISDSVCYTRFYANKGYNSIFFEKVRYDTKTITQGVVAGLDRDEKLVSVFEAGQYFMAIVQQKENGTSFALTYKVYRFDVHGRAQTKEINLWNTGFFEFKYDIQDCFLLCQESDFRTDNAITIPPTNYQPGFVLDNNYLYFYAFHKSQLFVQQIDILNSAVTQQVFNLSTYFSGIAEKSKFSLTVSGRNMMLLKYDEQSLAFAQVDIYTEKAIARRLLTYLDLQKLEYFYIRKNDGVLETGTELIDPKWFKGFGMKKPLISMRATDSGDNIITIGLTKMREINKFARTFGRNMAAFTTGFMFGAFGVFVVVSQPNNTGIKAQEQAVEVFDFKLRDNYFYPAPAELDKRKRDFEKEGGGKGETAFQQLRLTNGKVLTLGLR